MKKRFERDMTFWSLQEKIDDVIARLKNHRNDGDPDWLKGCIGIMDEIKAETIMNEINLKRHEKEI